VLPCGCAASRVRKVPCLLLLSAELPLLFL
jgi:hypothetical protein